MDDTAHPGPPAGVHQPVPTATLRPPTGVLFIEIFAGEGRLSQAVARLGVRTAPPQDLMTGGFDFSVEHEVRQLWVMWKHWAQSSDKLIFHFAPPCSTFSTARDRSPKTKLRSATHPEGIPPISPKAHEGNRVAASTALSIAFVVVELSASCTMENPARSYLWAYLDQTQILASVSRTEVFSISACTGRRTRSPQSCGASGGSPVTL